MIIKELKEQLNKYDENKEVVMWLWNGLDCDYYSIIRTSEFKELKDDMPCCIDIKEGVVMIEAE